MKYSISSNLDNGSAFVGDLYDLKSAITFNDEKINNSWNKILSHNISKYTMVITNKLLAI